MVLVGEAVGIHQLSSGNRLDQEPKNIVMTWGWCGGGVFTSCPPVTGWTRSPGGGPSPSRAGHAIAPGTGRRPPEVRHLQDALQSSVASKKDLSGPLLDVMPFPR